ncbi:hypothetical protein [Oculatella sp. LEGE 06141]|nr:hypothetical protein [Oculatella sp. LEGE 06141]
MVKVPDRVSMDELSNWLIYKALQDLETERNQEQTPKDKTKDKN